MSEAERAIVRLRLAILAIRLAELSRRVSGLLNAA
jgi:hypothetical protein